MPYRFRPSGDPQVSAEMRLNRFRFRQYRGGLPGRTRWFLPRPNWAAFSECLFATREGTRRERPVTRPLGQAGGFAIVHRERRCSPSRSPRCASAADCPDAEVIFARGTD